MVDILIRLLMALEAVVCLMLIGVILIQRSKGRGMGVSFGGGSAEAVFGAQMGNVLTRTTVILAIIFLVNTTLLAILKPKGVSTDVTENFKAPAPKVEQTAIPAAPETIPAEVDASAILDTPVTEAPAVETPAPAPAAEAPAVETPAPAPAAEAPAAETPEPAPAAEAPAVETAK